MVRLPSMAIELPRFFIWVPVFLSVLMVALVLAPTLSPSAARYLHPLTVDADSDFPFMGCRPRLLGAESCQM